MSESQPTRIAEALKAPETERPPTDREIFCSLPAPERGEVLNLLTVAAESRGYLAGLGVTPANAFRVLLASDYVLRNGSPDQKIGAILALVKDYEIDPDDLQDALENGYPPVRPINYQ